MAPSSKRIALIVNGLAGQQETLEQILTQHGHRVDVFDVHSIAETADGFEINGRPISPVGYDVVSRLIKGSVSGDTEKSLALQGFFELAGAAPHIATDVAKTVTDKILCRSSLAEGGIPISPSVVIRIDGNEDLASTIGEIKKLGPPPYAVRKSLGSGKGCLTIAHSVEGALQIADQYRNPAAAIKRGAIIHRLPPSLGAQEVARYGIENLSTIEDRPYHFRVVIVDGRVFETSVCYSEESGQFGLNPAQGCRFHAARPELLPDGTLELAGNAAAALRLKVAAIDICLGADGQPEVLDMNASPDLSQINHDGIVLKHAFAMSVESTASPEISPTFTLLELHP